MDQSGRVIVIRAYDVLGALAFEVSSTALYSGGRQGRLEYRELLGADVPLDGPVPDVLEVLAEALFEAAKQLRYAGQELDR